MNIRTSACYLAGGLYFLLFAAACTCSPSGKIPGGQGQTGPVQQMQAPAAADMPADEMIGGEAVEGTYYAEEGAVVESSSSVGGEIEMMTDDGGSSYVASSTGESSEGEVVEDGFIEEMPAAEGTVDSYSETTVTEGGDAAVEGGFVDEGTVDYSETTVTEGGDAAVEGGFVDEGTVDYSETTVTEGGDDEMMMEGPADGQPVMME